MAEIYNRNDNLILLVPGTYLQFVRLRIATPVSCTAHPSLADINNPSASPHVSNISPFGTVLYCRVSFEGLCHQTDASVLVNLAPLGSILLDWL
jgi:hypothetical protein